MYPELDVKAIFNRSGGVVQTGLRTRHNTTANAIYCYFNLLFYFVSFVYLFIN